MSGGRAWVSGRGLVWLYTLCTLVLVAEAWTESSLSEIALGFCQSTSSQVDTVTDTGPFSCNWPGFNPARPDVTPCGDDYLKVLLLEGWCPVTREWGHGKEPHDSNGLWPRGLRPLHWYKWTPASACKFYEIDMTSNSVMNVSFMYFGRNAFYNDK